MKKTIITILLCEFMVLGITGCGKEEKINVDDLSDTYNKVFEYFENEKADRSNLGTYSLDEENNVVIVTLIDNSKEKQEDFKKQANVNTKYIKFEQGGPFCPFSEIDFYISKQELQNDIKFNDYYKNNERAIYLAGNIEEFYIVNEGEKNLLKNYISLTYQTFDDSIKSITDKLDKKDILNDGGTIIYKSKEKDITMIVCRTIKGNKDVFIGDYSMEYEQFMCK